MNVRDKSFEIFGYHRKQSLRGVRNKRTVRASRRTERDRNINAAISVRTLADDRRLVERDLGHKRRLLRYHEILGIEYFLGSRFAVAVHEEVGSNFRRSHADEHSPRRTVTDEISCRRNDRRPNRCFYALVARRALCAVKLLRCRRYFAVCVKKRRRLNRIFKLGDVNFDIVSVVLVVRKLDTREKDHTKRLDVIFIYFSVYFNFHFFSPFLSFELSITIVTGPSLVRETFISAPKIPVSVFMPEFLISPTKYS